MSDETRKGAEYRPRGRGALALDPKAFGFFFDMPEEPQVEKRGDVAIVSVRGPLMHHKDWWFDSYDEIKNRVQAALDVKPRAVVLQIDSPGGLVSGCFETSREIKALCAGAGVPLYAFVDGFAASAAYALACSAEYIVIPEAGVTGSIGVISELTDATAAAEKYGYKIHLVTSGARKADGHPQMPLSDDAIAAVQKQVDALAEIFFKHVSAARGLSVDEVRDLEAGLFVGAAAAANQLADNVGTFEELIAMANEGSIPTRDEGDNMGTKANAEDDAKNALQKLAESDDEEVAKKAKRALAALEGDEESESDEKDDKAEDAPADEKKDEPEGEDEKKDEDAKASSLHSEIRAAVRSINEFREERAREKVEAERKDLLASRPDFSAAQRATLEKASIETVRDAVKNWERGPARTPAASASVVGTRGEGQGDGDASRLPPEEKAALDAVMGLVETKPSVVNQGNKLILGATTPVKQAQQ